VALGSCLGPGHTLHTRGTWALPLGWALPSVHVALGLSLLVGDKLSFGHGSGQVELWSWLRTQGEWVGRQDP